jgi:hypothetical protein
MSRHPRLRTSESKKRWKIYDSGAAFEFEVPKRTRGEMTGISNSPREISHIHSEQF